MKERLVIKKFGPIKEADLSFGRFNVLIGEQATGKSTVAKLLCVCRYFSYLLPSVQPTFGTSFEEGLAAWGLAEYIHINSTEIFYECEHYSFEARSVLRSDDDDPQKVGEAEKTPNFALQLTPISERFKLLLSELERIKPQIRSPFDLSADRWQIPTSFYQNEVASVLANPFYLPAERGLQSIFSLGKTSIQNISDSLFNQFAKLDHIARLFKRETFIEPLDIIYKNDNGRGFIKKNGDDRFLSLYNGASGYQSTIPIILLMIYYNELEVKNKTIIIEEPELNLFPKAQNKLVEYLVDKTVNNGGQMFITTHSPYILTALNNLIFASHVGRKKIQETAAYVNKRYWIDSADISAYRMLSDGTSKNIIEENGMISAEELDEISNTINQTFDKLCEIEYGE